jgi:DNA topoisomerase II
MQEHWLGVLHADYRKLSNQARFIKEIIDNDLIVGKKKKAILVAELRDRDYEPFPPGAVGKKKADDNEENEQQDEEEVESTSGDRDYDYLLSVSKNSIKPHKRISRLTVM